MAIVIGVVILRRRQQDDKNDGQQTQPVDDRELTYDTISTNHTPDHVHLESWKCNLKNAIEMIMVVKKNDHISSSVHLHNYLEGLLAHKL